MGASCLALFLISFASSAAAQPPSAASPEAFFVEPIARLTLDRLPAGALYWRVERFPEIRSHPCSSDS